MYNNDVFEKLMDKKQENIILNDKDFTIKKDVYHFEEIILFEDTVKLTLPIEFEIMTNESADQKYPYLNRPEIIYSNSSGEIAVTFDLTETEVTDDDLLRFILGMRAAIKKMNPANTFYNVQVESPPHLRSAADSEKKAAWFDFRSYAIDGKLYNIFFVVNLNNRLLLGSFSCPFEEKDNYELFAKRIILSITPTENEVPNNEI